MLDVLEVQDKLKNFSQEQLLREMQMPTGSVPQFLVLSELNRRRTMSQDMEKQKMADQPTVKEEVVAASGMPMPETSMLAQQMAPQTSMSENTGIAAMMPKELPSEEEPMKMSFGGLLMGSRMLNQMAAPLARDVMDRRVTDMEYRPDTNQPQIARRRYSGGLGGFGSDIMNRVSERSRGDVDSFLGEVEDMAEDRFNIDLAPRQRQIGIGGKGQLTRRAMPAMPFAMNEGGPIKAQGGMFADIGRAIGSADAPSFSMPPAFASIYNFIKTNFPNLSDAEVRRQAEDAVKAQQNNEIPRIDAVLRPGLFKEYDMAKEQAELATTKKEAEKAVREGLSADMSIPTVSSVADIDTSNQMLNVLKGSDNARKLKEEQLKNIADASNINQALSNFTGGEEMSDLIDSLGKTSTGSKSSTDPNVTTDNQMFNVLRTRDDLRNMKNKDLERIATAAELANFSGGAEMSNLVNQRAGDRLYDPTIYGESEDELAAQRYKSLEKTVGPDSYRDFAFGFEPKTRFGKYFGQYPLGALSTLSNIPTKVMEGLETGTGATRDFFMQPLVDGKPYDEAESLAKYVGLPASMVDDFNKSISKELKEKAKEDKQAFENFSGGKEMDNLVEEVNKKEKEKRAAEKKAKTDSAGTLGGFGATSGALSELEAEIDKLRAKREKGRESDKWFALAEVGLGMLASQSPTLAGALGEGGLKGLKSFREGKKEYDKDMLGYLTTKASIQKTRGELGLKSQLYRKQIKALEAKSPATALKLKDILASRDRLIGEKVDLLKDPKIQMDYDAYIKSGGKEASGLIGDILALDEKIKQSETQLGSAFATVDLNTVN